MLRERLPGRPRELFNLAAQGERVAPWYTPSTRLFILIVNIEQISYSIVSQYYVCACVRARGLKSHLYTVDRC